MMILLLLSSCPLHFLTMMMTMELVHPCCSSIQQQYLFLHHSQLLNDEPQGMYEKLTRLLLCYGCQNMKPVHFVSRLDPAVPHQIHRRKKHFYNEIVVRLQVGFECLALLSSYDKYMCQRVGVGVGRGGKQVFTTQQQQRWKQRQAPNETCLIKWSEGVGLKSRLFRSFILRSVTAKSHGTRSQSKIENPFSFFIGTTISCGKV